MRVGMVPVGLAEQLQPPPPGKGRNKLRNVPLPSAFEDFHVVKCGSHRVWKDRQAVMQGVSHLVMQRAEKGGPVR